MGNKRQKINVYLDKLGIKNKVLLRDLWRQNDLDEFENTFETEVYAHGVVFVKVTPRK